MKIQLTTLVLFLGLFALASARNNSFVTTGEFFHRVTSYWREGNMSLSEAQARCTADGKSLPHVNSQRELNHMLIELAEMYWNPEELKYRKHHKVVLWSDHKVNFLGDQGMTLFADIDDTNGQYCAVFSAIRGYANDLQGNFRIEGRDCADRLDTVCVRDTLYRDIIVGPTTGQDQLEGDQATVEGMCQDRGMDLFEVTADSDLANLGAELNRLGFPRYGVQGPFVFYTKNKVGGTIGDNVTFSDLTPGSNCLILMSRPLTDVYDATYDMFVADCAGQGRAICTGLPAQGKFYNQLTIGHVSSPISKTQAKQVCKDLGNKKLPLIKTRQDLYDLSAELVRIGLYEGSTSLHHWAFFWLDNPTDAANEQDLGFSDLILSRRGGTRCVGFSNQYSTTALELFGPVSEECSTEIGLAVCTVKTVKG